ncbi:MAG: hypothetical protein ACFHWX_13435 [Bacteroidota bacterium]
MSYKKVKSGRVFLLATVFFFAVGLQSLTAQQRVKVELWDNSLYVGPIYRSIDSVGVHLTIEGSDVLIPHDRIENIQFINSSKSLFKKNKVFTEVEKGYYNAVGLGMSFGNAVPGLSINLVNGYQWGRILGTGIGIGYEAMDDISTIPVYAEVKGYLKQGKNIPYLFVRPGYGFLNNADTFGETSDEKGGIYWNAGMGYQFNFEYSSMVISIGHMGQDATVSYSWFDWWSGDENFATERRMKRRIAVRLEFIF